MVEEKTTKSEKETAGSCPPAIRSWENVPKPYAKYKEGDEVIFTLKTVISKVGSDCDGAVLYEANMIGFGWSEDHFMSL